MLRAKELIQYGHHLEAAWIPGHCDFGPNEEAESDEIRYPAERKEISVRLKEKVKENWQFRVDINLEHHKVSSINKDVGKWFMPQIQGYHWLLQLASGHHQLNQHLCKVNNNITASCLCGEREDADHFMFTCECYSRYRFELVNELNGILETDANSLKQFSWKQLLGQDELMSKHVKMEVVKFVLKYVRKTKRFETRL